MLSIVFVNEIIKVCFCLVRNYAHKSCAGPAKMRMKRVPHLSLSSVFINVGGGKHSVSHPANASCTEPAGANSFIYYIARLDSEKPDHPVMARRERRKKKKSLVCVSQKKKQPEDSDRVGCFRTSGWRDD